MNFRLFRTLALVALVPVVASACSKSPTQPSLNRFSDIPPAPTVMLSNLTGRYVGMSDQICGDASAKVPIEDLTLDYQVNGGSLAGALLIACDTDACGESVPLGVVVACPAPPDPCATGIADAIAQGAAPACLTGDPTGSGSVQILAQRPSGSSTWNIKASFGNNGGASNTVSAAVDQPQAPADGSMSSVRSFRRLRSLHR
jgi:hypothetical protein